MTWRRASKEQWRGAFAAGFPSCSRVYTRLNAGAGGGLR
jgi:hypothetical protein